MNAAKLHRIARAAAEIGVARQTLLSAVDRGELRSWQTACGLPLVSLADAKAWAKQERKPGRKPAS